MNPFRIEAASPLQFNFINVCWGAAYSKMCVEDMLPTLLSPGNLAHPSLAGRARFFFYTTPADYEQMRAAPAFQRLEQLMPVLPYNVADPQSQMGPGESKYSLMAACHRHATQQGNQEKSAVVYVSPDLVASDGLCRRLVELADMGKTAVLVIGSRLSQNEYRRLVTQL